VDRCNHVQEEDGSPDMLVLHIYYW